jgi:hypothetical protein
MKIKLVLRQGEFTSFTSYYLEKFWGSFFDISYYDTNLTYDKNRTLFAVWWQNADSEWPRRMRDDGYKVVVDNLWERPTGRLDFYWIENKFDFFWWNESLWWHALGYSSYIPNKDIKYSALLQLRRPSDIRNKIVNYFESYLDSMLWSYSVRNKKLPNDIEDSSESQRFMHPSWYDYTYCSLVVETFQNTPTFITEKSYKPMAYFHPFMIIGGPGTLSFLKQAGFETFENLFDESYDEVIDLYHKLKIIKSNLSMIDMHNYDKLTQDKLNYNHQRFFNTTLVSESVINNIINPLIAYAEA